MFIKNSSLISALLLSTTAGLAHAAIIAKYDISEVDSVYFGSPSNVIAAGSGYGTATLDSSGLLTMHLVDVVTAFANNAGYLVTADSTMLGVLNNGVFSPITGMPNWTSCTDTGITPACSSVTQGVTETSTFVFVGGTLTSAGGTLISRLQQFNNLQSTRSTYTLTPVVPVPAAAWLFGSGLIGMTGASRRRRYCK